MALAACSNASATPVAESLPVLVMDDAHFQNENVAYEIPAGNGFILDAKNYTFKVPSNAGPLTANYLQLVDVAVDGEFYGMEWQSEASSNAVTADKLQPLSGTVPLDGFISGQTVVIAVGNMTDGFFTPLWTATIEVK
jgi:hypothetical protein